ncbi:protein phosphatase CheZ [methanotrophic endosymbiont of Bathymodiolus puteoserpentis (Logatchev)]|jgi:chemotaxis protein CheZ|uniref:protein phosphatase CheZ n=1 Tax=methanotrophic endosymbiont of Bathymodiolus puteoserpentis (Logatchev) TaxID=343235 RepID=UPI0013C73626|nr:protein phosphatase CheZ [methanotrophic endosymbiont of Bathymodiolus puteoserpentis (Logatchev)]SHE23162.1 Chemotaxis response-phosphatase CheZ [methanotrophic endosymbiont of Bathymodiolus puteoserpentis (Logatchev)]
MESKENPRLLLAQDLVVALENNDETKADEILDQISGMRESMLFQEVGRLTRQLHDTMNSFALDSKMVELTSKDIPDAKERLHYVIAMTEQAANQTMAVIESLTPISQELSDQANELSNKWDRFLAKDMPFEEFKNMSQEITMHFAQTKEGVESVQTGLTDILMAQSFQDITGQIIRRVIDLVQEMEHSMVELVRISGGKMKTEAVVIAEPELPGPVVPGVDDKANDVATSQDDVDDLLSSLGF